MGLPKSKLRTTPAGRFSPRNLDELANARATFPDQPRAIRIRRYLEATQWRRLLVPLRLPGAAARAVRAGAILAPDRAIGKRTWEQFVADAAGRAAGATGRFQSPSDVAHP
jgi:hypothetical protein